MSPDPNVDPSQPQAPPESARPGDPGPGAAVDARRRDIERAVFERRRPPEAQDAVDGPAGPQALGKV